MINTIINGDCLEVMKSIPDKSIDMILCDLPYGTTACKWDVVIPFEPLWEQYKRIIKDNGAIVLTAREPFTSILVNSNIKNYKHKWIWNKKQSGSFQNAKYMPLQIEEDIIVFSNGVVNYYPIMRTGIMRMKGDANKKNELFTGLGENFKTTNNKYYPTNILEFANCINKENNFHPTQKSVKLFEYLIKTYTNENETVLDNCSGSGTTAVACINTNRNYICIEKDKTYFDKSVERVAKENIKLKLAI